VGDTRRSEKFMGDTVDLGRYREIHVRFRDWREIMDKYTDPRKDKVGCVGVTGDPREIQEIGGRNDRTFLEAFYSDVFDPKNFSGSTPHLVPSDS
jgi:hypothetical protein